MCAYAQTFNIITADGAKIAGTLIDSATSVKLLSRLGGVPNNHLRAKGTARTYQLRDGRLLVEFYDRQAMLINNNADYEKLRDIRFVKNRISILKKNISYKIELSYTEGLAFIKKHQAKKLAQYKSDMPEFFDFAVYQTGAGQLLYLDKTGKQKTATLYPDIKTLSSDNPTIAEIAYRQADEYYLMKKIASGDVLSDYEPRYQFVYPKYLKAIIRNHQLSLVRKKVYVSEFYGNLYKSAKGYYILIDEWNQKSGSGDKMSILSLRFYPSLKAVQEAEHSYEENKGHGVLSEHFYQQISDKYGERFPEHVKLLIDSLPGLLNINKERMTLDSAGILVVDEAFAWNSTDPALFDRCFPSLVAYYGQCYIIHKKDGKWSMLKDDSVWIPMAKLKDGTDAWDWIHFYKDLLEGPIPLTWAGNWDPPVIPRLDE